MFLVIKYFEVFESEPCKIDSDDRQGEKSDK